MRWIDKKDDRLLIWLERQVDALFLQIPGYLKPPTPQPDRYNQIIFSIDIWKELVVNKISFLHLKQAEWSRIKTPSTATQWINPKNESLLVWCWEYLSKNHKAIFVNTPTTNQEYFASILASLDTMSYEHPDTKKLFLERMKKTWSQKKYRDSGKAKKQYSLPMEEYVREQLQEVSKYNNEKVHETLERIIRREYSATPKNGLR